MATNKNVMILLYNTYKPSKWKPKYNGIHISFPQIECNYFLSSKENKLLSRITGVKNFVQVAYLIEIHGIQTPLKVKIVFCFVIWSFITRVRKPLQTKQREIVDKYAAN